MRSNRSIDSSNMYMIRCTECKEFSGAGFITSTYSLDNAKFDALGKDCPFCHKPTCTAINYSEFGTNEAQGSPIESWVQ